MNQNEAQNGFNKLFESLSQPGAYSEKIKRYLNANKTYSLHKQRRKKFKRRRIITYYPLQIIQMDLMDVKNISRFNYGWNYILTIVDCFSKFIWLRKLRTKNGSEVTEAIKSAFETMDWPPQTVIFDEGLEFKNQHVNRLFMQYNIHSYSIQTSTKAGAAERANRTIKSMMYKIFTANNTHRWTDVLQKIAENYNNTYHRVIKMAPNKVTWKNRKKVFKRMFPNINSKIKCKLKIGNRVRIALNKHIFEKGYTKNWSDEIYIINSVKQRAGVCWYKLVNTVGKVYPKQKYYYQLNLVSSS
mgnify:CR=1 FL=1